MKHIKVELAVIKNIVTTATIETYLNLDMALLRSMM
jgi:hypothetical protein